MKKLFGISLLGFLSLTLFAQGPQYVPGKVYVSPLGGSTTNVYNITDGSGITNLIATNIFGTRVDTNFSMAGVEDVSTNKVIVIVGDSIAQGCCVNITNSWAWLFARAMTNRGWITYNEAIGGSWAEDLFKGVPTNHNSGAGYPGYTYYNFITKVLPHKPMIVINAVGFNSFNSYGGNSNSWTLYQRAYAQLLKGYGIQPVFVRTEPWYSQNTTDPSAGVEDDWTPYSRAVRLSWEDQMSAEGIPTLDFASQLVNRSGGTTINALGAGDSLHPSEYGHALISDGIPLGIFDAPWMWGSSWRDIWFRAPTYLHIDGSMSDGVSEIVYTPSRPMTNWTISVWVRAINRPNAKQGSVICVKGLSAITTAGGLTATYNEAIMLNDATTVNNGYIAYTGSVPRYPAITNTSGWTHLCMVHNQVASNMLYYVNGNLIWSLAGGSSTYCVSTTNTVMTLASSLMFNGLEYADLKELAVYRVSLTDYDVQRMYKGKYQLAGMEVFHPFDDASYANGVALHNLSPSREVGFIPTSHAAGLMSTVYYDSRKANEGLIPTYSSAPVVTLGDAKLWKSNITDLWLTTTNGNVAK